MKNVPRLIRARVSDDQYHVLLALKTQLGAASDSVLVRMALQRLAETEGLDWPDLPADFVSKRGGSHGGGRPRKHTVKHTPPKD